MTAYLDIGVLGESAPTEPQLAALWLDRYGYDLIGELDWRMNNSLDITSGSLDLHMEAKYTFDDVEELGRELSALHPGAEVTVIQTWDHEEGGGDQWWFTAGRMTQHQEKGWVDLPVDNPDDEPSSTLDTEGAQQ